MWVQKSKSLYGGWEWGESAVQKSKISAKVFKGGLYKDHVR